MVESLPEGWAHLPTRRELVGKIERLDISADAKLLLGNLATITMDVGGRLIEAGRRILAFAFDLLRSFPNTAFGVIVAHLMTILIASIPLFGALLGPLLAPMLLAFGLGTGALMDMKEGALRRRIERLEAEFKTITA